MGDAGAGADRRGSGGPSPTRPARGGAVVASLPVRRGRRAGSGGGRHVKESLLDLMSNELYLRDMSSPTSSTPKPGLLALALLLLRTVLLFVGSGLVLAVLGGNYAHALRWTSVTIVVVDVVTLLLVSRLLARENRTLRGLLAPGGRSTAHGLLVFVVLLVGFLAATFIGNLAAYQGAPPSSSLLDGIPLWLGLWALLPMPVTIALAEESLYRGYATDLLGRRLGTVPTLVVVALFFALQHAALTPWDLRAQVSRFVTTLLTGLLLGALRLRYREGLWPLVVAHWLLDVLGLGLPTLLMSLA